MECQNDIKKKWSGYSSYFLGSKNNNNSSIEMNKWNHTVQLSYTSCHKEQGTSLETKTINKYPMNNQNNNKKIFLLNSTTHKTG